MKVYQVGESILVPHGSTGEMVEAEITQVLSEQYFVEYFEGGEGFAFKKDAKELKDD